MGLFRFCEGTGRVRSQLVGMGPGDYIERMRVTYPARPADPDSVPYDAVGPRNDVWGGWYSIPAHSKETRWHRHERGLLGFKKEGLLSFRTPDLSILLTPGMACYIPPGAIHQEVAMGLPIEGWFIILPDFLTERLPAKVTTYKGGRALSLLCDEVVSWGPVAQLSGEQKNLLQNLVSRMQAGGPATPLTVPIPHAEALYRVATALIRTPGDMCGIDHWAKIAQMPRRTFTRHFHSETGTSFNAWRKRLKIYAALRDLTRGRSVKFAAGRVGYKNPSTFIAHFRSAMGATPTEYLRRFGRDPGLLEAEGHPLNNS